MKKIFIAILLTSILLAEVKNSDDCLCFNVKGKFAQELKELVEKYQKSDNKNFVNTQRETTKQIAHGKELYNKRCVSCHGADGMEEAYNSSRAIRTLSKDDFLLAINGYSSGSYEVGGRAFIMTPFAAGITTEDAEAIHQYLQILK
jgi:mono/diheme cytochrome c family protein